MGSEYFTPLNFNKKIMTENVTKIKQILEDYFTEEHVDCCVLNAGAYFKIWFPVVTVTNENNQSTIVRDLFVKFDVNERGLLTKPFEMGRTTFTEDEIASRYLHSHCSGSLEHGVDRFFHCCLGSGPLISTISTLMSEFNEGIWMLFCGELDLYTKTESIAGVPYRRLDSIGSNYKCELNFRHVFPLTYHNSTVRSFLRSSLMDIMTDFDFPITYNCGKYKFAMSDLDVFLKVNERMQRVYDSNPEYSRRDNIDMFKYVLREGSIYRKNNNVQNVINSSYADTYIVFKGERKMVNIIRNNPSENTERVSFAIEYIEYIVSTLLFVINMKFSQRS